MLDKVLIFISLVSTPAVTRVADSKIDLECGRTDVAEFKCLDGKACFQFQYLCDGVYDCADGSDESACTDGLTENPDGAKLILLHRVKRQEQLSNCRKNQWRCQDGTCISFDGKCDGVVNCPDRSDETLPLCRNMPCQANWFRCTYGACVDGTAPCNGIQECADNSDELLPRCRNQTMEVKGKFRCKDGTTIDSSDLCDGKNDCLDKSDEVLEACANRVCPSYLFQCAYGACVDRGADCDGIADCADGSDESSELCNRIGKPHVIEAPTPGVSKPGFCILPSYPPHGHYTVANVADARPGQTAISYVVNVTCHPGYGIMNDTDISKTIYCVSGIWYSSFPQCVRYCKLHEDPSVNYFCRVGKTDGFTKCPEAISPGTTVKPVCNTPNYYSPEALAYMNCIDGSFDKVITCKPDESKATYSTSVRPFDYQRKGTYAEISKILKLIAKQSDRAACRQDKECGRVTPEGIQLVAGGTYAKRGEVPWHVGVYSKRYTPYMQICGASLVSNDVVLSAAHCFWSDSKKILPASDYALAAGKLYRPWNDKMDDAQKSDVKAIHIPSLFQGSLANFQEDIAVAILVTPFVYKTHIRPVCLNFDTNFERQQLVAGHFGKVAGWGLTGADDKSSPILKVVDMPYVTTDECIRTLPLSFREYITGDKLCAGYTNGTALCQGDSGGGLAFVATELGTDRYYLRGIVSTSPSADNKCNVNTLTTFTRITKHDDFIKQFI